MAQTTAQRQAAYWARRATAGEDANGERRLDMWVSSEADLALARADDAIVRRLDPD